MENQQAVITAAEASKLHPALTLTQQSLVEAQKGPKVNQATTSQFSTLWNRVAALLGIKVAPENRNEFENEILEFTAYVCEEYPDLYLNEIYKAYRLAVKRELDIETLIPVLAPTYFGVVWKAYTTYRDSHLRPLYKKQYFLEEAREKPAPTPEEQEKMLRDLFAKALEMSKSGQNYYDAGNLLFNWLLEKDLIFFSQERIDGFFARASQELQAEAKRAKQSTTILGEVVKYNKMLEDARNQDSAPVIIRAKHISFNVLLKEVIELEIGVDDYLNSNF